MLPREEELPERFSTRISYLSMVNSHIRSKWADFPLDKVKPMAVEEWLRQLPVAPKSRANIRSLMYSVFRCAERWELIEMGKNPIALVRVKDCSKRLTTCSASITFVHQRQLFFPINDNYLIPFW